MTDTTLQALARATVSAYHDLWSGTRKPADVYASLTATFAEHGLDENTAESAVDWFDGGPELLVESLRDALSKPRSDHVHVWGPNRACQVDDCDIVCGLDDPDEWCHECGAQFTIDDGGTAQHVSATTPDGIDHDADADHVPYSLPDDEDAS